MHCAMLLNGRPGVILILCSFVVFTTARFMLSLALLFVLEFSVLVALWSPCDHHPAGEERSGLYVTDAFVCLFILKALIFVPVFSFSRCQGLAAACDCGTP